MHLFAGLALVDQLLEFLSTLKRKTLMLISFYQTLKEVDFSTKLNMEFFSPINKNKDLDAKILSIPSYKVLDLIVTPAISMLL